MFAPIYKKSLCVILIIFCLGFSYRLYQRIEAEYRWNDIAYLHATDESLRVYKSLMPVLGSNPYFLYNYAVILLDVDSLDESLDKALRCRTYWADYDLELLLGDIYKRRKEYEISERYYKKASYMCPCRFIPLYRMFEVYKEMGDKERYQSMAQVIIAKPVKVQSSIVRQIKHKVKREVK